MPCRLCGLPTADSSRLYCCSGCEAVDEILEHLPAEQRAAAKLKIAQSFGLPKEQLEAMGALPDEERLAEESPKEDLQEGPGIVEQRFHIDGLHCPSCAWLAEHTLMSCQGVLAARVDFLTEVGSIRIDLRKTSREKVLDSLDKLGYRGQSFEDATEGDPERLAFRFGVAAIAAMNAMMLAFVHYVEVLGVASGDGKTIVAGLAALISIPAIFYTGAPIFRRALGLLRHRSVAMETLLAIGIGASLFLSFLAFVLPGADFYFEIPTMIVATALASRLVDRAIRRRGARKVLSLLRPRAVKVRIEPDEGQEGFLNISELDVGHRIIVPAGEEVPADTEVFGETVSVSEAVLTGEPIPVTKRPGSVVLAGSVVSEGELRGEVLRPPAKSAYAQIGDQILEVVRGESESTALSDRLAAIFVLITLIIACVTIAAHGLFSPNGLSSAGPWLAAISVLVVACPCAFSIAASASMGTAAIRMLSDGLLLRNPSALENAASTDVVVFDKTGTLTQGDMDVHSVDWRDDPQTEAFEALFQIEKNSRHPMAVAIRRFLKDQHVGKDSGPVTNIKEIQGLGRVCRFRGGEFAVGAPGLFENVGEFGEIKGDEPRSWVLFGPRSRPVGRIFFDDPMRESARRAIRDLRDLGVEIRIFSGDDEDVVRRCAENLGVSEFSGRMTPKEKAKEVEAIRKQGHVVAYLGDGVNDGPALAAASIGIAMRHGASLALETSDVLSLKDDPQAAGQTIGLSRRLKRITIQNYMWAVGYNVVLIPIAAFGWLHPLFAAIAMLLSSITVLANSSRMLRIPAEFTRK